ncbi:hypothetical protein Scep_018102 [Stephania cephalantha]|uniref:Bromodomain-containing protein n=1 Tax=Stephania cephalantha TaxID=152367 RepID=A0AAP0NVI0_9MAGN
MAKKALVEYGGKREAKQYSQKMLSRMGGRTNKLSRGNSSSFLPDYNDAEITGDSEGFDSCGRVDTEMAASEGSCAPKRKCISLNVDSCNGFGVPMQVISVSKLVQSEREELKMRLREELGQVRMLQKKLTSSFTNSVALPSFDGMPSHKNVKNISLNENLQVEMSAKNRKQVPSGPSSKQGLSSRSEFVKQAVPSSTSHMMLMKQCDSILQRLLEHKFAWVFKEPVDVVKLNIPDYFNVIKHPMDLGTIKGKIASSAYSSPWSFLAMWKTVQKKLTVIELKPEPLRPDPLIERETVKIAHPAKKRKMTSVDDDVKVDTIKTVMTEEEKLKLSRDLESLIEDLPLNIIDFLRDNSFNASQVGDDEIEIDIDDLSGEKLMKLRKLVDDHLLDKKVNESKAEPSEIEILNHSGISNSLVQPCKATDLVDEDVDIGGNDPPILSYPPLEIEKDSAHRNSKCSSSSSSSSDSGSSSSDSDSGSSSGNESEGVKASPSLTRLNEKDEALGSGEDLDHKTSDLIEPNDGNQSVSGLDQLEQTCQTRPASVEADSHQDGASAQSARQVSPDKLYRAALLRSRFADTILKAREKTFNQGEKGDPEKLRREKEELERKQKEEKARLLAEAKAAEDARRQAEAAAAAAAAAEAKRIREIEREAARQALLKMEKTVEINENSQFLEDLEMLGAVPVEHIPSSVDETSPDHSDDGAGGFKFRGTCNPLEQLGLYMKMDDDEEEEGEGNNVQHQENDAEEHPENDVEEGEID